MDGVDRVQMTFNLYENIQVENTLKYHFSCIRLAKIQRFDRNILTYYVGKAVGKLVLSYISHESTY